MHKQKTFKNKKESIFNFMYYKYPLTILRDKFSSIG